MQLAEQVLIGGIEGLQRFVGLLRLAQQIEAGEGGGQNRHANWRYLSRRKGRIKEIPTAFVARGTEEEHSMTASAEKFTRQRLLEVRPWSPKLFSLRCTRDPGFRFSAGQFARLGVRKASGSIVWRA